MAVSEQAPALDLEGAEEKEKAVVTNDDFEERLADIRRYMVFVHCHTELVGPLHSCK